MADRNASQVISVRLMSTAHVHVGTRVAILCPAFCVDLEAIDTIDKCICVQRTSAKQLPPIECLGNWQCRLVQWRPRHPGLHNCRIGIGLAVSIGIGLVMGSPPRQTVQTGHPAVRSSNRAATKPWSIVSCFFSGDLLNLFC